MNSLNCISLSKSTLSTVSFCVCTKYSDSSFYLRLQVFTNSDQFISRQARCGGSTHHSFAADLCCTYYKFIHIDDSSSYLIGLYSVFTTSKISSGKVMYSEMSVCHCVESPQVTIAQTWDLRVPLPPGMGPG